MNILYVVNTFSVFEPYGIKIFSNTIFSLPDSTLNDDLRSLELTLTCHPTYSGFNVFTPLPATSLYKYSKEHGYLTGDDLF